jgi:hypothetical protein
MELYGVVEILQEMEQEVLKVHLLKLDLVINGLMSLEEIHIF